MNKLINDNIEFADIIAYKKKRNLPKSVSIDEVKSAAYMGLVDAASRYDSKKGNFSTYAYYRINGAILDYLRELNWKKGLKQCPIEDLSYSVENNFAFFDDICISEKAKDLFQKYFVENYSLKEIALNYGLSECRIHQMMTKCKSDIKRRWEKDELI